MKRMSEVFDLPVSDMDLAYLTSQAEDGSMTFAENIRCKHAAHAINHADKLAHALASMLVEHSKHQLPNKVSIEAALVLEAYRGAE